MQRNASLDIAWKELAMFFSSPIGYLFLAAYLGVTLFVFFWVEQFFARNIADVRPMFEWLPILLIFLAAALTMRSWSDERRIGTIEFLSTMPVRDWELVAGKFLACLLLLIIALAMTLPIPITVSLLGNIDWGPVFAGYVASILLGAAYLSIGVFISARSENQIVALILSVFTCGVFYAIGSPFLTELFGNETADVLRGIGSGSRFESITRGVVDFRDLYFYVSVTLTFLVLNVHALRSMGWSDAGNKQKHRNTFVLLGLLVANLLIANIWLNYVKVLRWDVTEGDQYSISDVTKNQLGQLTEPLLIRGYFSAKTHPLLAPLVPQLSDLLAEYEISGRNVVRVELIDPTTNPEVEDEANSKYGIRPVPFQVRDRHEASLVNSYFNVLVMYGDDYEVLGFQDLIEVKAANEFDLDVQLKNPEYQITRSIKKVQSGFRSGGSPFDFIPQPVRFDGYISNPEKLPPGLEEGRAPLISALEQLEEGANGKFSWSIVDPEAGDGSEAERIAMELGLQPMAASLFDVNRFYYYLTLTDDRIVVTLPIPEGMDVEGFNRVLEEGLQRFAAGLLTSIALYSPTPPPTMPQNPYMQQPQQVDDFREIYATLTEDFDVQKVSLDSPVPTEADLLMVVAPDALSRTKLFHVDQFLMAGGTVVVASSAYTTTLTQQAMTAIPTNTGMSDWLAHHGVEIEQAMLMDSNNSRLPVPVTRQVGPISIQEVRMIDYPYFVELSSDGLNSENPITNSLNQLALPWSSPLNVNEEIQASRAVTTLLHTGNTAWRDNAPDIRPKVDEAGNSPYFPSSEQRQETVGVLLEGRFDSFFTESPVYEEAIASVQEDIEDSESEEESIDDILAAHDHTHGHEHDHSADDAVDLTDSEDTLGTVASVISQSPESARLIVFGSSSFVADSALGMLASARGQRYTDSLQLMANIADWSTEDTSLMSIRGRGQFTRTLPPLSNVDRQVWEYVNYALAMLLIAGTFGVFLFTRAQRNRRYREIFGGVA